MRLFLSVSDSPSGTTEDVILEVTPSTTFSEIEPLLEKHTGRSCSWMLDGRLLTGEERVADTTLRDGAILEGGGPDQAALVRPSSSGRALLPSLPELVVVEGPHRGERFALPTGEFVIGRSRGVNIQLGRDEELSRRHARIAVVGSQVAVEDLGSSNGTLVDDVPVRARQVLRADQRLALGASVLRLQDAPTERATLRRSEEGYAIFNRPPRIRTTFDSEHLSLPLAPQERSRSPLSVAALAMPLAIGIATAVLLKRPEYLLFAVLSPLTAVGTYLGDRRRGRHSHRRASQEYERRRAGAVEEIVRAREREREGLLATYPGPDEVFACAHAPLSRLWERRVSDDDFLALRLGTVDRRTAVRIDLPPGDPEPGFDVGELLMMKGAPETLSLRATQALGIVGAPAQVRGLARWLAAQAATQQAPDELGIWVLANGAPPDAWGWVKWLAHVRSDDGSSLARVATSADGRDALAAALSALIDARGADNSARTERSVPQLVVLDGAQALRRDPRISRAVQAGATAGVYFLCLDELEQQLPEECRAVISVESGGIATLRRHDGIQTTGIVTDSVSPAWCEALARALAPIRLDRLSDSGAVIPTAARLLDVLGLEPPTPGAIAEQWQRTPRTTTAVFGVTASGPLNVDVRSDGPHALIAGTTGAGKSELLQSFIASLAARNRPDALGFVLIDYKGGSAFSTCARLPHTVGMVTDLDAHLTERALESLGAELRWRERVLAAAGAKDLDDYQVLRDRAPGDALAVVGRLVIVIDEFAALVEELPAFVDGLVDIARRGRSLGIHLVLATQRPAGVVSAAIRTNTNLRIALRVTDTADSSDVIDSPLAARIPKTLPGRAYLRSGHEQLVQFQTARIGGNRPTAAPTSLDALLIPVDPEDLTRPVVVRPGSSGGSELATDLEALVDAIVAATEETGAEAPRRPWLDPLAEVVDLETLLTEREERATPRLVFGKEDVPALQAQRHAAYDLGGGHLVVSGDPGSGRSTFLRTLAASVALSTGPDQVHLYALDCGNGALAPLAALPHCGAVVHRSELERVDRLFAMLQRTVDERQRVLATGGFASLADQHASVPAEQRLPYVLLLLDRWEGFLAAFDALDGGRLTNALLHLMREGIGAGLRVVITGDRSALSGRLGAIAEERLVMRLNDRTGYGLANLNQRSIPQSMPPGRAFRSTNGAEIQIALVGGDPSGPGQAAAIEIVAQRANAAVRGAALPRAVAPLPPRVALVDVLAALPSAPHGLALSCGVGGDELGPVLVDLARNGPGFVVAGPPGSGRSTALSALARSALAIGTPVLAVLGRPSPLQLLDGAKEVLGVLDGATATAADLDTALSGATGRPVVVIVDDADRVLDRPIAAAVEALARDGRDRQCAVILGGSVADLAGAFRGLPAEVRRSRSGLLLRPQQPADAEMFGVRLARTLVGDAPAGRGVLVTEGRATVVQVGA